MIPPLLGALTGFMAGSAVAIGGAIKDAPCEGFSVTKFFRSPAIGAIEGAIIQNAFPTLYAPLTFFVVVGSERMTTETYKVLRAHTPSKFTYGEWGVPKTRCPRGRARHRQS